MAWACMAVTGNGSLLFIDDVSSKMNAEVYRNISDPSKCMKIICPGLHHAAEQ